MKRHKAFVALALLSLLLALTFPVGASSPRADLPAHAAGNFTAALAAIVNRLPEGFHESHFEGDQNQFTCFAVGWAVDPDNRTADLNIRVFSDGVEVAQTVAGLFRQDLADAGVCKRGTCNFSVNLWGLISPGVDHLITVQAQDAQTQEWVNLEETPRTLNCTEVNALPVGFHDGSAGTQNQFSCLAEGWAVDPNDRNADLNVRILSDGMEVAQTVADTFRPDLEEAGECPGGTCSFSIDLWGLISPGTDHLITVQAQDAQTGEWADVGGTPRTVNCSEVNVMPEGFHDFADGTQNQFTCVAEGWAADPNDRNIDLNIRIFSDGIEVARTVASTFRPDLEEAGECPGGTCSFSVDLWGLISPEVDHLITVQAQDAQTRKWVNLSSTPRTLSCFEE